MYCLRNYDGRILKLRFDYIGKRFYADVTGSHILLFDTRSEAARVVTANGYYNDGCVLENPRLSDNVNADEVSILLCELNIIGGT